MLTPLNDPIKEQCCMIGWLKVWMFWLKSYSGLQGQQKPQYRQYFKDISPVVALCE